MGCDTSLICITGVPRLCVSISVHTLMDAQHVALAISNSLMSTQTEPHAIHHNRAVTAHSYHIIFYYLYMLYHKSWYNICVDSK